MKENKTRAKRDPLILVNIMEEFVRQKVDDTIRQLGACDCKVCRLNACALALNELRPKYVTTTKGAMLSEITAMELENRTDIVVAVTKAVKHVAEHPRH